MIERVYLLLEILTYLLILNDLCERKFELDFPAIMTIATEVILFRMVKEGNLPQIFLVIPYMAVFVYCKVVFRQNIRSTLGQMLLAFLVLGGIQLSVGFLSGLIGDKDISAILVNAAVFGIVLFLIRRKAFFNVYSYLRQNSRFITNTILVFGVLLTLLRIYYALVGGLSLLDYCLCVMICLLLGGMVYTWEKEHRRLTYKTQELETFNQYHLEEKTLYSDVRKKQHEFKNQLNALYSTHYTCATYEELIEKQKEYADWLVKDNRYNDLLLSCKPSILAGFIYNRIVEAGRQKVQIDYQVQVIDIPEQDREYDYICVFGALFDNAMEAVRANPEKRKKIEIAFAYDGVDTQIQISNISPYIENDMIADWFKDGFSTKGNARGNGLGNVVSLRNKYKADIVVENRTKEGDNWISICFRTKKQTV